MAVDYRTVLTDVTEQVADREATAAEIWAGQAEKARPHPAYRIGRAVLFVGVLVGLAVVWTPLVRKELGGAPVHAASGEAVVQPEVAACVRSLWRVRAAFDGWRARHGGRLPETLAVLPADLRNCPVTGAPWRYVVGAEGGYQIACPDPAALGVGGVFLDPHRGPPQVLPPVEAAGP